MSLVSSHSQLEEKLRPEAAKVRPFMLNAQIGFLEAFFAIMEFTFGVTVCQSLLKFAFGWFVESILGLDESIAKSAYTLVATHFIVYWVLFRFCRSLHTPIHEFLRDCFVATTLRKKTVDQLEAEQVQQQAETNDPKSQGRQSTQARQPATYCDPCKKTYSLRPTALGLLLIAAQISSALVVAFITNFKYYSTESFIVKETGQIKYGSVFEMLILNPLREEIVFRGVVVSAIYRRIGGFHPQHKIRVSLLSGFLFGFIHVLNLFSDKFSQFYILLQVVFGFFVGYFYSLRFMKAGLMEPIILHVANNAMASFFKSDINFTTEDTWMLVAFGHSLVLFIIAAYVATREIQAMGMTSFPAIDGNALEVPLEEGNEEGQQQQQTRKRKNN